MNWKGAIFGAIASFAIISNRALSVPPAIETVIAPKALAETTEIILVPGRQSLIEFRNGETIQFISLADVHQIVFSTDLPVDTGRASVIVLKTIEPLRLKGVVETPSIRSVREEDYPYETIYPTNLVVVTSNQNNEKRTYTFDLTISLTRTPQVSNGVAIVPEVLPPTEELLTLTDGRQASLLDIRRGYVEALKGKYTAYKDPVVEKIKKFLDLARHGVAFIEAAQRAELPFAVIESLAEIGLRTAATDAIDDNRPSLLRGLIPPIRSRSKF
ncbi:MAG: hypothetical protein F6K17_01055 [Okeania sp. SIO3C4]|nr:hypothetical protein [Okeania sp. SIO3C4]